MNKPTVDMSRPTTLYAAAGALLLFATFVIGRLPLPSISEMLALPYSRAIAGGVLVLSIGAGLAGAHRHAARMKEPWRIPQSQPLLLFAAFFVLGLIGLALSI